MKKEIFFDDLKRIELSLLDALDCYCKKNGLRYYLAYGTLIGAVRHKGFIPWDDDIDVIMPRPDYEKLIDSFNKDQEDNSNIKLYVHRIDNNYCLLHAKLIDTNTVLKENVDLDYEIGVYLDIFPLDNLANNFNGALKRIKKGFRYDQEFAFKIIKLRRGRSLFKNLILITMKIVLIGKTASRIVEELDEFCCETKADTFTKYVGVLPGILKGDEKRVFEKEWFEESTLVEFEGKKYQAPKGYDSLLRKIYGDYMQLPPIDKQVSHHVFEAWYKD